MNKTCRGCNNELDNCTCNVLTTRKEQTEELKLIDEDERLRASLISDYHYAEIKDVIKDACQFQLDEDQLVVNKLQAERDAAIYKVGRLSRELREQDFRIADLERINEAHHKENDRLNKRIEELEALIPTKEEAEYVITTLKIPRKDCDCDGCKFYRNIAAKLQKIIDKRG